MIEEGIPEELKNLHAEMLLVGCLYKSPDLMVSWSPFMRSKYDFSDEATGFLYDNLDLMYKTFSQTTDEMKINTWMAQNDERLREYKRIGGYKTIQGFMDISDVDDFKNVFDMVKKYSILREYYRNGFNVTAVMNRKKFPEMKAIDIYKWFRNKADKVSTVILANEESAILNEDNIKDIYSYLIAPQKGIPYPWPTIDEMFRGCRLGKVVLNGFLSNEGKSRNLMLLVAWIALVQGQKFLLLSNEMSEEDLRSALLTTVINNPCFQKFHGVNITKPEREIVLGIYYGDNGEQIVRYKNEDGGFSESESDYMQRVYSQSEEFRKVVQVGKWIEERGEKLIFFKDVGEDYSDERIEFEIRKHNLVYGIEYTGYDTLKGYRTDDWQTVKQTATKLKELMKELNCYMWAVFQLTDDTVFTDFFSLSSNNLSTSKQVKHVVDYLLIGKKISPNEYGKYEYTSCSSWGSPETKYLDPNKKYFAMMVDKNRGGSKAYCPLFEYDLDLNKWNNIGSLKER